MERHCGKLNDGARLDSGRPASSGYAALVKGMAVLTVLLLTGCATISQWGPDDREKLVTASKEYNTLLRWRELDKACVTYVEELAKASCLDHALTLKELQITDIRTRDIDFKIDGVEATVQIEIEYYLLPSTRIRKIQQSQKWSYIGPKEKRSWFIKSPLPEFTAP